MNNKHNFIQTSDSSTIESLMKLGFQKVNEQNGVYTFLNCSNLKFSDEIDKSKIHYSNILCI